MSMPSKYAKIVELAKRRGFFWPSFEIYGGVSGYYDFGPLGSKLKRNIENLWREYFVERHSDFIVEIETPVIMPKPVFEASGHLKHFTDYMVQCCNCGRIYRADHLIEQQAGITGLEGKSPEELSNIIRNSGVKCPECDGVLGPVKKFNLLMKTNIGPYKGSIGYGRPEAAQGMFVNFKRVYEQMGGKLPLGIAQIGRVMRNEISPRQGLIRVREFTIMELELFYDPKNPSCHLLSNVEDRILNIIVADDVAKSIWRPQRFTVGEALSRGVVKTEWNAYFMAVAVEFLEALGVPDEKQVFIDKPPAELAHYSAQTFDQLVRLEDFGWVEVSGHAYRTDYDLSAHIKKSGADLRAFRKFETPLVVERLKVRLNMSVAGRVLREKAKAVAKELSKMNPELVFKRIKETGWVEVLGEKITQDMIIIEKVSEKIHGERFVPHVAEPSFGAERLFYVTLEYAYREVNGRIVLSLPKRITPIKAAVFPLVVRDGLPEKAREVYKLLKNAGLDVIYDDSAFIGRLYARADEIGVPVAITIDYDTLKDDTVTLRDRDTWMQVRVNIRDLPTLIHDYIMGRKAFDELGILFRKPA